MMQTIATREFRREIYARAGATNFAAHRFLVTAGVLQGALDDHVECAIADDHVRVTIAKADLNTVEGA